MARTRTHWLQRQMLREGKVTTHDGEGEAAVAPCKGEGKTPPWEGEGTTRDGEVEAVAMESARARRASQRSGLVTPGECIRVGFVWALQGVAGEGRHNYHTNLLLIKLIRANKLLRNQE